MFSRTPTASRPLKTLATLLFLGIAGLSPSLHAEAPAAPAAAPTVPAGPAIIGGPPTIGVTPEDIAKNMVSVPGKHFKISKYEVTRAQYEAFVKATSYQGANCRIWDGTTLTENPQGAWDNPGFPQSWDDPAVCINWDDAEAYLKWLNEQAKPLRPYRLPKNTEWIAAAQAGATGAFPWGADTLEKGKCNCMETLCADGNKFTSPQGKFPPNKLGVVDMGGNAWEWTTGCYLGDCTRRIILGGSWISTSQDQMRTDFYWGNNIAMRTANIGLRLFQDD